VHSGFASGIARKQEEEHSRAIGEKPKRSNAEHSGNQSETIAL
jgi:hypothetical protein